MIEGDAGGDTEPLYLRIAAELRARIASGGIPVGRTIPALSGLCTLYRCSLATAQKAVKVLRDGGYVTSAPGRGTYVLSANPDGLEAARVLRDVLTQLGGMSQHVDKAQRNLDAFQHSRQRPHH
ncbi:GntR family transcriptional regulator [Amycolatopsis japonica]